MTRQQYLKHREIIDAWANGAEIEFKSIDDSWVDAENPNWILNMEYRVKPQPTYLELHEKCELKVGDRVKISETILSLRFNEKLKSTISKIGEIVNKDSNSYRVKIDNDNDWFYPYFVLEKYVEEWIPFTFEDDLLGKRFTDKESSIKYLLTSQTKTGIGTDDYYICYEDFLKNWIFLDGSPCGKLKQ